MHNGTCPHLCECSAALARRAAYLTIIIICVSNACMCECADMVKLRGFSWGHLGQLSACPWARSTVGPRQEPRICLRDLYLHPSTRYSVSARAFHCPVTPSPISAVPECCECIAEREFSWQLGSATFFRYNPYFRPNLYPCVARIFLSDGIYRRSSLLAHLQDGVPC
jgi:hypothetical protein